MDAMIYVNMLYPVEGRHICSTFRIVAAIMSGWRKKDYHHQDPVAPKLSSSAFAGAARQEKGGSPRLYRHCILKLVLLLH